MSGFTIDISGDLNEKMDRIKKEVRDKVNLELKKFAGNVVATAQHLAPVDEGTLRNSITYEQTDLFVEIIVSVNYAAYLEFGTRKFAAAYVSTLPPNWQTFAAQFKGGKGGNFDEFLMRITEWIHRKGLGNGFMGKIGVAGSYSLKTRKRVGGKDKQAQEDKSTAYVIALSILRNGIKPHPFLYPAVEKNLIELKANLKAYLK